MIDLSYENRFGGLQRIYGPEALKRLKRSHVMVVGLGGVGSWTVEALARSGIGTLTLVDLDDICATNTNRQLHALDPEWGRLKVEVLAERVRKINPEAVVNVKADFFTDRSASGLLAPRPDLVIDAIDRVADKAALVRHCRQTEIPVIVCGGAGGKTDPTRVRFGDLGQEQGDALLKAVKRTLKAEGVKPDSHGFWDLECVYSLEPAVLPWDVCQTVPRPAGGAGRIDCESGFGAVAFATGAFGLCLASRAVYRLMSPNS